MSDLSEAIRALNSLRTAYNIAHSEAMAIIGDLGDAVIPFTDDEIRQMDKAKYEADCVLRKHGIL